MNIMPRTIDHIVYAVFDLEAAIEKLASQLGVAPVFGGYHSSRGTKNALLNLSKGCYLEVLAIDHGNTTVAPPRWMGIDLLEREQVCRWCLKSDDLFNDQAILRAYHDEMGAIWTGERQKATGGLLQWEMILPLAGPAVELVPFMTDWARSTQHPTDSLPQACELVALQLFHPQPGEIQRVLDQLGAEERVAYGAVPTIEVTIDSPMGRITI